MPLNMKLSVKLNYCKMVKKLGKKHVYGIQKIKKQY